MADEIGPDRRRFLGTGASTVAAAQVGTLAWAQPAGAELAGEPPTKEVIRPFRIDVPEEQLTDLRRRIQATRWPERETVADAAVSPVAVETMLDFAARHNLVAQTEHFSMSRINEVLAHLEASKARYRIVLDADY